METLVHRERIFRGADVALYSAIPAFVVFLAIALAAEHHSALLYGIGGVGGVGVLALLFRIPPRRIRVIEGVVEVAGLFGTRRLGVSDFVGVRFSRSNDRAAADIATFVFRSFDLDLHTFTRSFELSRAVAECMFEPRAEQIVSAILGGAEVRIGRFVLRRHGFSAGRVTATWAEIKSMMPRPEGFVILLVDRPQDTIVISSDHTNPIPFLPTVAALLHEADLLEAEEARRSGAADPDVPPSRSASSPGSSGMPREHPELGELIFEYRASVVANLALGVGKLAGSVFGLAFIGTLICHFVLGKDHVIVNIGNWICGGALVLATCLGFVVRYAGGGTGRSFVVYKSGIADRRGALRWRDVTSIHLAATRVYRESVYRETRYAFVVRGRVADHMRSFRLGGAGPQFEAYVKWFEDTVLPVVAPEVILTGSIAANRAVRTR